MIGGLPGLAALLAVGFVLSVAAAALLTAHRLRRPPRRTAGWAASRGVPADPGEMGTPRSFTPRMLALSRAEVELWEIEGDNAAGPVVIVTPGWGDSKIGVLPRLDAIAPWASLVIAWDPPGLGVSPGACGLGVHEPALLNELCGCYAREAGIVLYGWSLGGGASVSAGTSAGVHGVIAEAPYRLAPTPARNVLRAAGLPYRLNLPIAMALLGVRLGAGALWRGFDRAERARHLRVPLLVLHGTDDAVCPVADGEAIAAEAADGSIVTVPGGGHNDLWSDDGFRPVCADALRAFGERLTGSPAVSA